MATKITFYGHAALGIETGGYQLLVDPYLSGNPNTAISKEEVKPDYILVTHGHGDHLGDSEEIARRTKAVVISNSKIGDWLEVRGVNTHMQQVGGGYQHPFGYLLMTFALHGSNLEDGTCGGMPGGFLLTTNSNERIYLAGDTGLFGDMRMIGEAGIDVAALPIGGNYTMGPVEALQAVKLIQPRFVIPIHYNTFDLIKQDEQAWKLKVEKETKAKVILLKPGENFVLPEM